MGLTIGKRINMKKLTIALLLFTLSALTSKGVTRTKELVQGRKRSEMLTINTIKKSDLYVRDYRPVGSSSRWSSVVIAANVVSEVLLVGVVDVRLKVGRVNKPSILEVIH